MGDQKSEIDRDEVRRILKILKENYDDFSKDKGTVNDITTNCDITKSDLGNYPAVTGLSMSSSQAYTQIKGQYNSFLQSYQGVIEALESMVGNHEKKEQENTAAANRAMNGSGGSPNTGNTGAY
ncbi:hypothetical protein [Actinomadura latina]|uniref:Uncharacterized protein n=1 Tax=Actinomadura latina TaxID=163603 RepID=A0A846YWJ9_9ACTN|nr:hypothetical protein [Actinomadura latina]NKZ02463.1 hypothetical protein [Actinomadura latina]